MLDSESTSTFVAAIFTPLCQNQTCMGKLDAW